MPLGNILFIKMDDIDNYDSEYEFRKVGRNVLPKCRNATDHMISGGATMRKEILRSANTMEMTTIPNDTRYIEEIMPVV